MGKLKVTVTGSRGFIGSSLTKKLRTANIEVMELDLKNGINLLDPEVLKKIPSFDTLVHLAARNYVPESYEKPLDFYSNNLVSTLHALELCRINHARMIFTSSYVYGIPQYLPIDEDHPVQAFNPYADTKLIGEKLSQSYNNFFGIEAVILRPFNVYGPHQNENFLIPSILNQLESGHIKLNDSRPKRDFVFIDDLVDFFLKVIFYPKSTFEIFNVGSGVSYSVEQIVKIIVNNFHSDVEVEFKDQQRENEIMETRADISKAAQLLNWFPETSFEDGIVKTMRELNLA